MISIITVCYNAEKAIDRTIQSVLKQTCKNYEYIFVDGMSTDNTLKVIEKYVPAFKENGIKVRVVSERDRGIYDAMNKGSRLAEGDWINFLNAGDCFHDALVLERMQKELEQQADIVVGEVVYVEGFLGRRYPHAELKELKNDMIFCHQAVFASRKLFVEKEFNQDYRFSADYDWLLYMYMKGYRFKCVEVIVADYDSEGVSNQNREKTLAEGERIRNKYGIDGRTNGDAAINWKYRIYKMIAGHRCLAAMYYRLCGHKQSDLYWISRRG